MTHAPCESLERFRQILPAYRRYEQFCFLTATWDVVVAQWLVAQAPRPAQPLPVAVWAKAFGFLTPYRPKAERAANERVGLSIIGVDTDAAMQIDAAALLRPVLVAQIAITDDGVAPLLIDGIHRLYRAAQSGIHVLPSYVLTVEESRQARIQ